MVFYNPFNEEKIPEIKISPSPAEKILSKKTFIKGPIPLPWVTKAAFLPGHKTLQVGLLLWYTSGLAKSKKGLKITSTACELFSISSSTLRRSLETLETAGLIYVNRSPGKKHRIDLVVE